VRQADVGAAAAKWCFVRDSIVRADCSEWTDWNPTKPTPVNGWFGETICAAANVTLQLRGFSASALAASAKGGFV